MPLDPSSRSAMRLILSLRSKARGRPVTSQRLRMRVAEPLRGSAASLSEAAKRSSIGLVLSIAIALRRDRRPACDLLILRRRLFFSIELFFAIRLSLPFPRLRELSVERDLFRKPVSTFRDHARARLTAGTEN